MPGISVRGVADEREVIGNQRGIDAELLADPVGVADLVALAGPPARRGLRARTARGPCRASRCRPSRRLRPRDAMRAAEASASSASSSTMGQTATPMAASASSSGWNCASSARSTPCSRLVAGPETVAERLDDVVGRHADVRRLPSRSSRAPCAARRSRRRTGDPALVGSSPASRNAAQAVEVAEQLVGAVDEVNHDALVGGLRRGRHSRLMSRVSRTGAGYPSRATTSIARPTCSVVVTAFGKSDFRMGRNGRASA